MTEIKANIDEEFVEGISHSNFITHSRILDIEIVGKIWLVISFSNSLLEHFPELAWILFVFFKCSFIIYYFSFAFYFVENVNICL